MNNTLLVLLLGIPTILVATTVHEFTRALLSSVFGDNYPKSQKRLTLNPIKHFEPIGFMLMLYSGGFGWGKPVETSALYYKNRKRETLLVAILPSVANLLLGILFLVVYAMCGEGGIVSTLLYDIAYYNIALAVYNILPVAPMDCVKVLAVLLPANQYFKYMQYEKMIQMLFLFLLFFGFVTGIMNTLIYAVMQIFSGILGGILGMFGVAFLF